VKRGGPREKITQNRCAFLPKSEERGREPGRSAVQRQRVRKTLKKTHDPIIPVHRVAKKVISGGKKKGLEQSNGNAPRGEKKGWRARKTAPRPVKWPLGAKGVTQKRRKKSAGGKGKSVKVGTAKRWKG